MQGFFVFICVLRLIWGWLEGFYLFGGVLGWENRLGGLIGGYVTFWVLRASERRFGVWLGFRGNGGKWGNGEILKNGDFWEKWRVFRNGGKWRKMGEGNGCVFFNRWEGWFLIEVLK